ncbi:MAG TPA: PLD nuclease N-terminal domain-containing protein [Thermoleophilia bacterium]|nr:PLD nuclease N-terminal domain-containing protein [Thermoleophilia bacterium]
MSGLFATEVSVSTGALVAIVVVGLIELALAVFCIVDIVRRPAVLGGRKWLWIVFILFSTLVGSIVYLVIGRIPPPAAEEARDEPEAMARTRAQSAADLLYGAPERPSGGDTDVAGPR